MELLQAWQRRSAPVVAERDALLGELEAAQQGGGASGDGAGSGAAGGGGSGAARRGQDSGAGASAAGSGALSTPLARAAHQSDLLQRLAQLQASAGRTAGLAKNLMGCQPAARATARGPPLPQRGPAVAARLLRPLPSPAPQL
jgi:hypothetical protein